jgi:hypothetical protein
MKMSSVGIAGATGLSSCTGTTSLPIFIEGERVVYNGAEELISFRLWSPDHSGWLYYLANHQTPVEERLLRPIVACSKPSTPEPVQGLKFDTNKRRASLLPFGVLNIVIDVLEIGAKKYSLNNWQKVDNARTRYYDAALRHIDAWWSGQVLDEETGKHHLAHAICCMMFLIWFDVMFRRDLPTKEENK